MEHAKRYRDRDDEDNSPSGKRVRLDAASLVGSNVMQAVAHEALAMTNGGGFKAYSKISSKTNSGGGGNVAHVDKALAAPDSNRDSSTDAAASRNATGVLNGHSNGHTDGHDNSSGNAGNYGTNGAPGVSQAPINSMSDITIRFQDAVKRGWTRRLPTYASVDVLLVSWEEDGNDVKDDVAFLKSVFRSTYHYNTDTHVIRWSADASNELYAKVDAFFARNTAPDNLAILYYSGKILTNSSAGEAPVWTPRTPNAAAIVESKPIQSAYEAVGCDVLLLFDCCDAYHYPLNRASYGTTRRNVIEVLDSPSVDPDEGQMSFTKALAEELRAVVSNEAASSSEPFRIDALHVQVANRMAISRKRGRGRPQKEPPSHQHLLPKHYWLFQRRSIVLLPQPGEPQVVICLRVLNGSLELNQWGKWIYNTPPRVKNTVGIEGMHSGFSTMIILRVPVAEWDFFSECPAGSLVGYTTIGDIEPKVLEKIDQDLAPKLWEGANLAGSMSPPNAPPGGSPASSNVAAAAAAAMAAASATGSEMPRFDPRGKAHANIVEKPEKNSDDAGGSDPEGLSINPYVYPPKKRARKALPTERKILPSEAMTSPQPVRHRESAPAHSPRSGQKPLQSQGRQPLPHQRQQQPQQPLPPQQRQPQQEQLPKALSRQSTDVGEISEKNALLAAAAQKPFKISIKLAGQAHMCKECKAGFKDADTLHNHIRKLHTRPFHCVFNWAGCDSTFASKNEWKRHVMSQHILLQYWVCQVEGCSKVVNKAPGSTSTGFSLPNGAIFNRKDLFTQHLRRMHTPPHVKKLLKQAKQTTKAPNHPAIVEWETRLKELQQDGLKPRCRLPDYMVCPAPGCGVDFHGGNAWDDRMEHVARHLEAAAAGREPQVVFGGKTDTTLTNWSTRPDVGIAKRVGPNTWHLDNPLRPEIMAWTDSDDQEDEPTPEPTPRQSSTPRPSRRQEQLRDQRRREGSQQSQRSQRSRKREATPDDDGSRERSGSVIEVADQGRPERSASPASVATPESVADDDEGPGKNAESKPGERQSEETKSSSGIVVS